MHLSQLLLASLSLASSASAISCYFGTDNSGSFTTTTSSSCATVAIICSSSGESIVEGTSQTTASQGCTSTQINNQVAFSYYFGTSQSADSLQSSLKSNGLSQFAVSVSSSANYYAPQGVSRPIVSASTGTTTSSPPKSFGRKDVAVSSALLMIAAAIPLML